MPLGSTVPAWYNDNYYINEKVDECNTIKFGAVEGEEFTPWTADSVREFMAGVNQEASYAPWMGYDNFVSSGNAENCSPNPLFDVMQYVTAKAAQLNSINYDGRNADNNPWTAQAVLDYFNAHNITAWDHFTTAGQFENVNPSNAMDLSDFLANKAKECNGIEFDGRNDWNPDAVLAYFQEHGINAVMVAVNASDPNVVAVPEDEQVTAPLGMTPWGMATTPVDVDLTTGVDVMPANDAPINYVGTVANFNSTLNPNDQINGGNGNDKLTVNMDGSWGGFENGFVKDVPTVNLVNDSESNTPFTWNAAGTTGVDNYEIDGYVNLENLPQTGITVDYSNINNRGAGNALINFASTGASDDKLNVNLGENVGWLNFQSDGVENITLNSDESSANLNVYDNGLANLVLQGDAVYNIRTMTLTTKSLDMSDLTSDGNFVCLSRSEGVNSIIGGSGNDSVSVRNLTPNAVIDGGAGEDSVKLRSTVGSFQWDMKNVETLNVAMAANLDIEREPDANPAQAIFLDGSNTTGLRTFGIAGGNGYDFESGAQTDKARPIYFTNYKMDQVDVKVTGKNFVDLNIDTIKNVTVNVGDGTANNGDLINGSVTLLDATALTINTTDNNAINNKSAAPFQADVYAAKANNLTLGTSQGSEIEITGGDLSAVSNVAVSGYSDVTIDEAAALGQNAGNLRITNTQIGGVFTADLAGNSAGNSSLTYSGSSTNQVNLTLDQNYSSVNITTGVRDDVLTLTVNPDGQITSGTLKGTLGEGNDTVIVNSSTGSWDGASLDFSGLAGVEKIQLNGISTEAARALVTDGAIKLGAGLTATDVFGDGFEGSDATIQPGINNGNGGPTTFQGTLDTTEATTINGNSPTDAGGAVVNFGTEGDDLKITKVGDLTINGGSDTNTITGTPENINGNFTINDTAGTAEDVIDLSGVKAAGAVSIQAPEAGAAKFDVSVAQAASANLNAGDTKDASMAVTGVDGAVSLTAGDNGSTMSVTGTPEVQPDSVAMTAGAGEDKASLTGITAAAEGATPEMTVNLGEGTNSLTVNGANDLTGWNATIENAPINIADGATLNLGDNWANLSNSPISAAGSGKVVVTADTDLSGVSVPVTAPIDVATGKFVTIGDNFGAGNGITGNITGAGGVQIAEGKTVDLSAEGAPDITATGGLQMAKNSTLVVDDTLLAVSNAEGATGTTLEVKGTDAKAEDSDISVDTVKVDEGAKLTVDLENYAETGKFDPTAVTGAGTLAFTSESAASVPMGEGDPTLSVKTIELGTNVSLAATAAGLTALGQTEGATITGDGTVEFAESVNLATMEKAPAIETGISIADDATVTVGTGFAPEGAIAAAAGGTGTGILAVAGGNADAPIDLSDATSIGVKVQVNNGAFLAGDLADFASKGIVGEEGATAANAGTVVINAATDAGTTAVSGVKVDITSDGNLTVGQDKFMQDDNFNPLALSGDGTLTVTGALDLSDKAYATGNFFGDLTVVDADGITLGKDNAGMTMKVGGATNVTADLSSDTLTGATSFAGITAAEGATGTFDLKLGDAQTVTLSGMADKVMFTSSATADASTVSGWASGDKIDTATGSSFNGFSYKAALSDPMTATIGKGEFTADSSEYKATYNKYHTLIDNGLYAVTTTDVTVDATSASAATTIAGYFAVPDNFSVTDSSGTATVKTTNQTQPTSDVTIGALGLGSGESAILAIAIDATSTGFWLVDDTGDGSGGASDGKITSDEVSLLGVVSGLAVGAVGDGTFADA